MVSGITPLEIRFVHDPMKNHGFVGACLNANVYMFHKRNPCDARYAVDKVIDIPAKKVEGWIAPEVNGAITDILISLDE